MAGREPRAGAAGAAHAASLGNGGMAAHAGPRSAIPPSRLVVAVAFVSAGALAYQLLLMRWLAIAHWHPFAVMIISLALLGHGASGTWLGLWLGPALRRFDRLFPAAALLFALAAVAVPAAAQAIPFNGLELVWNPRQLAWLSALYLLLSLPFFFAASCFGLAFARHGGDIPRLYGADLLGAGAGAALAVGMMWLPVERALVLAAAAGLAGAALVMPRRAGAVALLALATGVLALLFATRALQPPVNEFKGLSKALQLGGARILAERHGPHGWLAVLASPEVPLRHAPGLSLGNTQEPPEQLAVFTDGDAPAVITRDQGRVGQSGYLARMTSALPYRLRPRSRVLVLGAGGGQDVLQALALGARSVDAVDANPQRLALVRDTFAAYAGGLFRRPGVRAIAADPRAFARSRAARYDLIVVGGSESFAGSGAGVQAASEQYALTVEALRDYRRALAPGGMLAVTRYAKQPPRDELKLWATAIAALRADGAADPALQLAGVRGWDASTLLLRNRPFDAGDIAVMRRFAERNSFDPVYHPGVRFNDTHRHNLVEYPYLAEGARTLLTADAGALLDDYKFAIAPATDDRPYFGNFFRWRSLPELWRLRDQGSAVLLDSGYLLLLATLAQALPWALVLVLLPLLASGLARGDGALARRAGAMPREATPRFLRLRIAAYFTALGLAFLFVEIASLSRLTLLVGHPLVAATIGLAGFLVFAGAGSVYAQRLLVSTGASKADDAAIVRRIRFAVLAIALGLGWQFAVFAATFEWGASWPVPARAVAALAGIAPLAFAMGLPFPLGLARLARTRPAYVPWAWGLNGCASVVAAIAALLLAMAIGLRATLLVALGLYALAAFAWGPDRH